MLLEIAIGDAYGAGFEFSDESKVRKYNDLTKYHQHELGIPSGHYTDDTQMSLAIAELLIVHEEWTRENIASKFVECFKRDKRLGYSKGFHKFLESINSGEEFLRDISPKSTRNGAAMRSLPLGYIVDVEELLNMAEIQASVTHNSTIGIKSSQAVALVGHYFIYKKGSKADLTEFVSHYSKFEWNDCWEKPVACCGEETVNAILTTLKKSNSFSEILKKSVSFTGDVDTVAAIALGASSKCEEYVTTMPNFLFNDLENGKFGKEYLINVGAQLDCLKHKY